MRYWFPHPILSTLLLLMWLLLNQSISAGHIVLGAVLGIAFAWVMVNLQPARVPFGKWTPIATLAGRVAVDSLRSHASVAAIVLRGRARTPEAGFLTLHIDLPNENALACLAVILTMTPGTAWLEFDHRDRTLLIHALDLKSAENLGQMIHDRYEGPLQEIFA